MAPPIRYAKSDDVNIAYQVVGDGPTDLVFVAGAITNLDVLWEDPDYQRFCERLGTFTRLLLFDKRGMGLSDRVRVGTLEQRMDDVRAVMDAAGSESAALMGVSEGGPLSMLFAAAHPERTRALILCGAEVKEETTDDWPWGEATRDEFEQNMDLDRVIANWGKGLGADYIFPNRRGDEAFRSWFGRLQTQSATPNDAVAFMRMAFEIDVRHVAPSVKVPTLILHRTDDPVCHVENARWLAGAIEGARYVESPGNDHVPWVDREEILAETQEFLTGVREPVEPDRVLATVLFTDIVGSTERALELGDRSWRDLLERHHSLVRDELGALPRTRDRHGRRRLLRHLRRPGSRDPLRAAIRRRSARAWARAPRRGSTPASASCSATRSAASPSTPVRASPRSRAGRGARLGTVKDLDRRLGNRLRGPR